MHHRVETALCGHPLVKWSPSQVLYTILAMLSLHRWCLQSPPLLQCAFGMYGAHCGGAHGPCSDVPETALYPSLSVYQLWFPCLIGSYAVKSTWLVLLNLVYGPSLHSWVRACSAVWTMVRIRPVGFSCGGWYPPFPPIYSFQENLFLVS